MQPVLASLTSAASSAGNSWTAFLERFFNDGAKILDDAAGYLFLYLLAWLLVLGGLYFTVRTGFVQLRLFPYMVRAITSSRDSKEGGISSFQAFAVGLASRVGTGNIVGVAIAITMGGPGAVFWMWIVALVGMATGFIEATLAQLYKVTHPDGTFRGGPAYYIQRGLGSKPAAKLFAVVITFVFGFAYEATQANTIAATMESTFHVEPWMTAVALVVITTPIIFKGIKSVAAVSEWLVPIMTVVYALIAVAILVLHEACSPTRPVRDRSPTSQPPPPSPTPSSRDSCSPWASSSTRSWSARSPPSSSCSPGSTTRWPLNPPQRLPMAPPTP